MVEEASNLHYTIEVSELQAKRYEQSVERTLACAERVVGGR